MPRIGDIKKIPNKPFKKKAYRPGYWNLLDENTPPPDQIQPDNNESIDNQLVTKEELISKQNVNKKEPKKVQQVTTLEPQLPSKESNSNPISNHVTPHISNQLASPQVTNFTSGELTLDSVRRLYGHQRNILFYIVEHCSLRGQLTSGPITNEALRLLTRTDADTVKTAVQRLVKKGFITRIEGKRGKGGFATFSITESVRNAVKEEQRQLSISNQLLTSLVTAPPPYMVTNWSSTKEPISPSSSGFNNLNTTTTGVENFQTQESTLQSEWEQIDIEPLKAFGFSKTHLMQIANDSRLLPHVVQDSIYAFAFDLQHNNKKDALRTNPVNYFMGVLRNGKPYAPPGNYESPQDLAMRLYVERQRENEKKRQDLEKEAYELAFKEWLAELTEQERNQLLPHTIRNLKSDQAKLATWRQHFSEEIWAKKRDEIQSVMS